ncbi:MAG: outer membrane beta-barrel protein, partial [Bacteroidales bacterium]|nr:outer membrane beta-barrel protein [Bacteroidales bacterium]
MKRFLIISAILLTAVSAQGQTTVVTGCIADSLTRAGEPAAILQFFKDEDTSKPIAYTTTDDSGHFTQVLSAKGAYRMLFSNIGRKQRSKGFILEGQDSLDLGTILIEDDVQTLKAGSITAQKTLVQMDVDKITYKIEDDVDSKTSMVLEMLRKVPMVSVDGQDNITVNGSSNFQVYVDGKPNQMISSNPSAILKTMPASFVKKIEVVTNPGARYDAEGVGGILNITTSSSRSEGGSPMDGQYGSIGAMGTTRGGGGNAFYSIQRGKLAFSMNGQAMYNRNKDTFTDIERVQKTAEGDMTTTSHIETDINIPMFTGSMNLSYEIDSLNLISAGAGWMHFGMEYDGINSTLINGPDYSFGYDGTVYTRNTSNNITANADYQHLWAGMPERSFILSYQFNGNPSVNDTYNTFNNTGSHFLNLTDRRSEALVNSMTHTIQADFSTPFGNGKTHMLNIGAKFISRHNSSDQEDFLSDGKELVPDPVGSLKYDFFNNI